MDNIRSSGLAWDIRFEVTGKKYHGRANQLWNVRTPFFYVEWGPVSSDAPDNRDDLIPQKSIPIVWKSKSGKTSPDIAQAIGEAIEQETKSSGKDIFEEQ